MLQFSCYLRLIARHIHVPGPRRWCWRWIDPASLAVLCLDAVHPGMDMLAVLVLDVYVTNSRHCLHRRHFACKMSALTKYCTAIFTRYNLTKRKFLDGLLKSPWPRQSLREVVKATAITKPYRLGQFPKRYGVFMPGIGNLSKGLLNLLRRISCQQRLIAQKAPPRFLLRFLFFCVPLCVTSAFLHLAKPWLDPLPLR